MKKIPVDSSNIEWVSYDMGNRKLFVGFYSGKTYSYTPVTHVGFQSFISAPSLGSYFYHHIKNNPIIKCEEVDPTTLNLE